MTIFAIKEMAKFNIDYYLPLYTVGGYYICHTTVILDSSYLPCT